VTNILVDFQMSSFFSETVSLITKKMMNDDLTNDPLDLSVTQSLSTHEDQQSHQASSMPSRVVSVGVKYKGQKRLIVSDTSAQPENIVFADGDLEDTLKISPEKPRPRPITSPLNRSRSDLKLRTDLSINIDPPIKVVNFIQHKSKSPTQLPFIKFDDEEIKQLLSDNTAKKVFNFDLGEQHLVTKASSTIKTESIKSFQQLNQYKLGISPHAKRELLQKKFIDYRLPNKRVPLSNVNSGNNSRANSPTTNYLLQLEQSSLGSMSHSSIMSNESPSGDHHSIQSNASSVAIPHMIPLSSDPLAPQQQHQQPHHQQQSQQGQVIIHHPLEKHLLKLMKKKQPKMKPISFFEKNLQDYDKITDGIKKTLSSPRNDTINGSRLKSGDHNFLSGQQLHREHRNAIIIKERIKMSNPKKDPAGALSRLVDATIVLKDKSNQQSLVINDDPVPIDELQQELSLQSTVPPPGMMKSKARTKDNLLTLDDTLDDTIASSPTRNSKVPGPLYSPATFRRPKPVDSLEEEEEAENESTKGGSLSSSIRSKSRDPLVNQTEKWLDTLGVPVGTSTPPLGRSFSFDDEGKPKHLLVNTHPMNDELSTSSRNSSLASLSKIPKTPGLTPGGKNRKKFGEAAEQLVRPHTNHEKAMMNSVQQKKPHNQQT
jgi:hypothetical protein